MYYKGSVTLKMIHEDLVELKSDMSIVKLEVAKQEALRLLGNSSDSSMSRDKAGFKDMVARGNVWVVLRCQITGVSDGCEELSKFYEIMRRNARYLIKKSNSYTINNNYLEPFRDDEEEYLFYQQFAGALTTVNVLPRYAIVGAHLIGEKSKISGILNYGYSGAPFMVNDYRNGVLLTRLWEVFYDLGMFTLVAAKGGGEREYQVYVLYKRSGRSKDSGDSEKIWTDRVGSTFKKSKKFYDVVSPIGIYSKIEYWFPRTAIEELHRYDGKKLNFYGSKVRPFSRALQIQFDQSVKNASLKGWLREEDLEEWGQEDLDVSQTHKIQKKY